MFDNCSQNKLLVRITFMDMPFDFLCKYGAVAHLVNVFVAKIIGAFALCEICLQNHLVFNVDLVSPSPLIHTSLCCCPT